MRFLASSFDCSDRSVDFRGTKPSNLKISHQFMDINVTQFEEFNALLLESLIDVDNSGAGLPTDKRKLVGIFLNSTKTDVCTGCSVYSAIFF